MKKLLCVFLTLSLCTAAFSGCASDEVQSTSEHTVSTLDDGAQVNDAFNTEVMTTLDGTTFLLSDHDNWFAQSEMGFGITNTEPVLAGLNSGDVGGQCHLSLCGDIIFHSTGRFQSDDGSRKPV